MQNLLKLDVIKENENGVGLFGSSIEGFPSMMNLFRFKMKYWRVTGMLFHWCQDEDNLKKNWDCFRGSKSPSVINL